MKSWLNFYDTETEQVIEGAWIATRTTPVLANFSEYWDAEELKIHTTWASYHEHNLNAIVKDDTKLTIENVRIKKFDSLQEFGKYRGVNNVLSRGFNGLEKAGNAALATQQEFFNRVFQKALELKANISVITKYYNFGKTLSLGKY